MFEKAIKIILSEPPELHYPSYYADLLREKSSEIPNSSDTISRQAVQEMVDRIGGMYPYRQIGNRESYSQYNEAWTDAISRVDAELNSLPSAQPEIIHCTECKHYREYDSKYVENAVVVQCMADRYPISETIPDGWFCAGAERKE